MRAILVSIGIFWILFVGDALGQPQSFAWRISAFPVFDEQGEVFERPFLGGFNIPRPQLVDIDGDGDLDLFIQEKSNQVIFFEHDTQQAGLPFVWQTEHYEGINVGEWFRFADLDGDGDQDLLAEQQFSLVQYFENVGSISTPQFELAADTLFDDQGAPVFADRQNILNVTDIDCDGMRDLFVGRADGTIRRYEVSTFNGAVPVFALVDERFQDIEIVGETPGKSTVVSESGSRHGANTLAFVDFDGDGDQDLFWGDFFEPGLLFFENSGSCEVPEFPQDGIPFPTNAPLISSGYNAPAFGDIDRDGTLDLLVGVLGGAFSASSSTADNLIFFKGGSGFEMEMVTQRYLSNLDFGSDSLPVFHDLDADGDDDLVVTNSIDPQDQENARAFVFENRGSGTMPAFYEVGRLNLEPGFNYAPAFGDMDDDGLDDMLVGSWRGPMAYYKKNSNDLLDFTLVDANLLDLPEGGNSTPALIDIDDDDDLDVVSGDARGTLNLYLNTGSSTAPIFAAPVADWMNIDVGRRSRPAFLDIDADDDLDMIVGSDQDGVFFFRNIGDAQVSAFQLEENVFDLPDIRRITPALSDLDKDGDVDFATGTLTGGLLYFQNQADVVSIEKPADSQGLSLHHFPNPASGEITIDLQHATADQVEIMLFDVTGREVRAVFEGTVPPGKTNFSVDVSGLAAGVYILKVTADPKASQTRKVVIAPSF